MQYLGGKSRIAKEIGSLISSYKLPEHQAYYEPFVGGANVLAQVQLGIPRYASDKFPELIEMYKALQQGWEPPTAVSKEEYEALRTAPPSPLKTFVGFACSYSARYWGGYAQNSRGDNYCLQGRNSLLKKLPLISDATFTSCSYDEIDPQGPSIIYCDPPYANTWGYAQVGEFDHAAFWAKTKEWAKQGHTVLVSEYSAPAGIEPVWIKAVAQSAGRSSNKAKVVEKVFLVPKTASISVGYAPEEVSCGS